MKQYFQLFANCIPVKGVKRSLICDVQRGTYHFVPNLLIDILQDNQGKSIEEIKEAYHHQYDKGLDAFFEDLEKDELAFLTQEPQNFPALDLTWEYPATISNAIIDVNTASKHDYSMIFQDLETLGCSALEMRFYDGILLSDLEKILSHTLKSRLESTAIYLKYSQELTEQNLEIFCKKHRRVKNIVVHSSFHSNTIYKEKLGCHWIFIRQTIDSQSHCGIISPQYFSVNIKTFTEAQKHNTCLNRKIGIDTNGDIKNCPSMTKTYGNITNTNLKEAINKVGFQEAWTIHKDQIKVCQDCEFRYICTDCRAFLENQYDKPQKCNYDPYTAKWT